VKLQLYSNKRKSNMHFLVNLIYIKPSSMNIPTICHFLYAGAQTLDLETLRQVFYHCAAIPGLVKYIIVVDLNKCYCHTFTSVALLIAIPFQWALYNQQKSLKCSIPSMFFNEFNLCQNFIFEHADYLLFSLSEC
jgi:hypothetical protein